MADNGLELFFFPFQIHPIKIPIRKKIRIKKKLKIIFLIKFLLDRFKTENFVEANKFLLDQQYGFLFSIKVIVD